VQFRLGRSNGTREPLPRCALTLKSFDFTTTQKQRLKELGGENFLGLSFPSESDRERKFDEIESGLARKTKEDLLTLLRTSHVPMIRQVERDMAGALTAAGFTEVVTPSIMSKEFITRMRITEGHNLWKQIFWLDERRCLRPMLAPNLYHVMRELRRISKPIRIFEVGSCFRKESKGREHAEEFTMLNAVELAPEKDTLGRLREIINITLNAVGIPTYDLQEVESEVYGRTIDVVVDGLEVASAAMGPHKLDANWQVVEPWVGVGFGLERLAMIRKKCGILGHVGRSLSHLNGSSLSVM
jgi:pyrrolysyl-tRNA synthetase-like protein